jgi:hypothetical protein
MSKLDGQVLLSDRLFEIRQDFSGGLTDAELTNRAHQVIQLLAHLEDHLRSAGVRKDVVDATVRKSFPIRVLKDLANVEKHGGQSRKSHSGQSPELRNVRRMLRVRGPVTVLMGGDGKMHSHGKGTAIAVLTADVVGADGEAVGELHELLSDALTDWEVALTETGLAHSPAGDSSVEGR